MDCLEYYIIAIYTSKRNRMNYTRLISVLAFTVLFFTALFLFMRNYPSDRLFSVVFVVAGGVLLWSVCGAESTTDTDKK
jgi:hypothetical protein